MTKKTIWFEVADGESVEECLKRMAAEGYTATGRKEEPLFAEVDGQLSPVRQVIKFSGILTEVLN